MPVHCVGKVWAFSSSGGALVTRGDCVARSGYCRCSRGERCREYEAVWRTVE